MKNLMVASFAMLFFMTLIVHTPVAVKAGCATGPLSLSAQQGAALDQTALTELCDSLALAHNYRALINTCSPYVSDTNYKEVITPYLIAAYYFTGDSIQSRNMLTELINSKSYLDIIDYLMTDNVALIKYFEIVGNREPVIKVALENYRNTVKASRKKEGEQIILFLINDQRIRKLKYAYKKESPEVLEEMNRRMWAADSVQNDDIYRFYKKNGRYFSAKEVGESVSYLQPIFFSHIPDIELRNLLFQPLLEKAVKEGTINKESLVNFILRTESFSNPEFWKTINDRLPEIRKQYNLSDTYFFNPF